MMRSLRLWLAAALLFCLLALGFTPHAIAEDLSAVEAITFNQMPPFEQDGDWPSVGEVAQDIGYDTARSWRAGEYPVDVLKLGDILELDPGAFRLSELANLDELAIADIGLVANLSLNEMLKAVPFSGEWPIEEMLGVAETLRQTVGVSVQPTDTLSQVIGQYPELGEMRTGEAFGELPATTIPNLDLAKISDFEGYQEEEISSIPGLGNVALGEFPNPLDLLHVTAKQDIAFGPKEYSGSKPTPRSVSGTKKEGFSVPCVGSCAHIELAGPGWQGNQWMTKEHRIPDGYGVLGSIIDEAGAYRLPFGKSFALQIRSTDEKAGSADWGLAFRYCYRDTFFDYGCTAYAFEVPLGITTYEKDTVVTGLKDLLGGLSQPVKAPPGWEDLKPDAPPEVQSVINSAKGRRRSRGSSLCGDGPGGVNFQPLAEAYGYIEGGYNSVGSYVNLGGQERGYGIGKYQYMTYRADVRQIIQAKPGGDTFLQKADSGAPLSSAEVEKFLTPADQDTLFKADQTRNIEQAMSEGFTSSRIIERIGQIHYGGPSAPIDGNWSDTHGRLTLKTYGEELADNYQKISSTSASKCKAATPVEPLQTHLTGTLSAQEYGAHRSGGRSHAGQDFDLGPNDTFQSYIGGTVVKVGYDERGYYNYVDIYNAELDIVERVAEIDSLFIDEGDTVQAGQVLGQGTQTTGVVHLEYRVPINELNQGGYGVQDTYDPIEYLEDLGVLTRSGTQLIPTAHTGDNHDH